MRIWAWENALSSIRMASLETAVGKMTERALPAMSRNSRRVFYMDIIEAVGVTKSFANGAMYVDAVRGIDMSVRQGEMLAIIGPSGSGKSTLLNLLGAIETPTTGHVLFEGTDLATLSDNERTLLRRKRIGFIFQAFNLLPTLTAVENAALPLELDGISEKDARERAMASLELVDIVDRADHFPSMMSGGEQQRVAVARALVIEPALVLGDEPTGNLDSVNSAQVMRLLRDLTDTRGQTVVIVTHDNDIAAQADRTVRVRDGHLEELPLGSRSKGPVYYPPVGRAASWK
jgi:putative ABC transport system ATP-binding protein